MQVDGTPSRLVRRHGARAWPWSAASSSCTAAPSPWTAPLGQGAAFTVTLPSQPPAEADTVPRASETLRPAGGGRPADPRGGGRPDLLRDDRPAPHRGLVRAGTGAHLPGGGASWPARFAPPPSPSTSSCPAPTAGRSCSCSEGRPRHGRASRWSSSPCSTTGSSGMTLGADDYLLKPLDGDHPGAPPGRAAAPAERGSRLRVLLIDDDPLLHEPPGRQAGTPRLRAGPCADAVRPGSPRRACERPGDHPATS